MNRVIQLPRRKALLRSLPVTYETVTTEERAAADTLLRKAQALHRLFSASFMTRTAASQAPELIAEAEAALAGLREMLSC